MVRSSTLPNENTTRILESKIKSRRDVAGLHAGKLHEVLAELLICAKFTSPVIWTFLFGPNAGPVSTCYSDFSIIKHAKSSPFVTLVQKPGLSPASTAQSNKIGSKYSDAMCGITGMESVYN